MVAEDEAKTSRETFASKSRMDATEIKASKSSKLTFSKTKLKKGQSEVGLWTRLSELQIKPITPWQQDMELHTERIIAVLDKATILLKCIIVLKRLAHDHPHCLKRFFNKADIVFIMKVIAKYCNITPGSTIFEKGSILSTDCIGYVGESKSDKLDPELNQLLALVWGNYAFRDYVIAHITTEDLESYTLIHNMLLLKDAMRHRLSLSAEDERDREMQLKNAYNGNIFEQKEIIRLTEVLEKQREDLGGQLAQRQLLIDQCHEKLLAMKENFAEVIREKVNESEKNMMCETSKSSQVQEVLSAHAKEAVETYESLLASHLAAEKALRAKKLKVEQQLLSWIAKFDSDIGDRQKEFEEAEAEYMEEKSHYDELMARFMEQSQDYDAFMNEKETEEREAWEARYYLFLCNRAARMFQRAWRAYKARKAARKKKRKGGKKKK